MKENKDRKEMKEMIADLKDDFKKAIVDKKRWLTCFIEILIAAAIIIVDLLTKKYIYGYCKENGDIIVIKNFFNFTSVENTGASFGLFGSSTTALIVVSMICSVFLFLFIFYTYKFRNLWLRSSLIMILGGALGNVIDRLALHYVRDFIHFSFFNPVFNFADCCLTVGTVVLIIYIIFFYSQDEKKVKEQKMAERSVNSLKAKTESNEIQEAVITEETVSSDVKIKTDDKKASSIKEVKVEKTEVESEAETIDKLEEIEAASDDIDEEQEDEMDDMF